MVKTQMRIQSKRKSLQLNLFFGSGKKRLFFLQLNQPEFSHNYCLSNSVEVFINKATVDAELALTQSDASVFAKFLLLKK